MSGDYLHRLVAVPSAHAIRVLDREALKEIERLLDAKPGTSDGDRLEVLTTLVEHYEAEHEPVDAPDPIEALLYHMESRGLTRRDLEAISGASRAWPRC